MSYLFSLCHRRLACGVFKNTGGTPVTLLLLLSSLPAFATPSLFIYGATPSGISAAITAAEQGAQVTIVEPMPLPGGMMTGGLSASDIAIQEAIGGHAKRFFYEVGEAYGKGLTTRFEPRTALKIFRRWLNEAGVIVHYNDYPVAVETSDLRITTVHTASGQSYVADQFIDASYEGDLMALAGVSFTYGREGISTYGESWAGVQDEMFEKQFTVQVDPFDENGELLPEIQPDALPDLGHGDHRIQAYNYRLCLTDVKDNQISFTAPEGYNPERYELLVRWLEASRELATYKLEHVLMFLDIYQKGKVDLNHAGPFSTNLIGGNWNYPTASWEERKQIALEHRRYLEGLLYFISTDLRIPEQIRLPLQRFGHAKDEFVETGNWPHQLYVREARRMLGEYVLRQQDVLEDITKPDSIGLGSHRIESHPVQRHVRLKTFAYNKGDVNVRIPMTPYQIPYRILTPLKSECQNLLVTVCVSASHIGYSSIRMEPQYMIMGQSAAHAAMLAVETDQAVQDVSIPLLQMRLKAGGQRLSW